METIQTETCPMRSPTMQVSGRIQMAMDLETMPTEPRPMHARISREQAFGIDMVALIMMEMGGQMMVTISSMILHNGLMQMEMVTVTTHKETCPMHSPTTRPNGRMPMVMDMETTHKEAILTHSQQMLHNGRTRMEMDTETTRKGTTRMHSQPMLHNGQMLMETDMETILRVTTQTIVPTHLRVQLSIRQVVQPASATPTVTGSWMQMTIV